MTETIPTRPFDDMEALATSVLKVVDKRRISFVPADIAAELGSAEPMPIPRMDRRA
jgi:hypothetical protein